MSQKNKSYTYLGGKEIPVEYKKIDINKLKYYPENPRILSILTQKSKKIDDELIGKELWDKNETHQLYKDIEKHGGLIHPIIVYQNYVLEGNTRLCCFRHLYKQYKDEKWKFIDCKIIKVKNLSKEKIDILLGNEHIIGKIAWDTFEKGCWMSKMIRDDGYSLELIKEIVGNSEKWIQDHVWSYETMIKEKIKDKDKFSHFVQIKSNSELWKIKRNTDPKIIDKTIEFIKNGQVPIAQDIRKIPKLWRDKKLRKKLEDGEKVDQAFHELKAKDITLTSAFLRDAQQLTEKMQRLTVAKRDEIKNDDKGKFVIKKLTRECKNLSKELNIKS